MCIGTSGIHRTVVVLIILVGRKKTRANRRYQKQQIRVNMEVEMAVGKIDEDKNEAG